MERPSNLDIKGQNTQLILIIYQKLKMEKIFHLKKIKIIKKNDDRPEGYDHSDDLISK